ncbi:diguanylate cyclase/phosphodiesterase with PAS/PAC sensor(s) [Loktanella fryxellensis]|uniref:Diguanylate cyclase/phosphodiesterase with PAS/PAC sensor(S) n=1 Tax=Loktanella fryxellensis TaxID=245187 RepID=A0A1H8AJW9_9RHOB|nr:EAL domain-containing protein [Loktanella fryxellensis]SEM69827.1 diguanylate cyclase/phosphodiesterase with PAS/PAC sensor(s) [Loktanella fryxellensis]
MSPASPLPLLIAVLVCGWVAALLVRSRQRARRRTPPDFTAMACTSTNDGIVVQTLDGIILWANPAYLRLMRLPMDRVVGRNPLSFCLPDADRMTRAQIAGFRYDPDDPAWRKLVVVRNRRSDGSLFWNQLNASFHLASDGRTLATLVCRDVSEQVEQDRILRDTTATLAHLATHDSLTGTANRAHLSTFVADRMALAPAIRPGLGLLHIDMDGFKAINDRHGHAAGDAALKHVARTIGHHLRPTDLLARVGGDEFVAVCTDVACDAELLGIGQTLCDAVRTPFRHDRMELALSVSVGAVRAGPDDADTDRLLQKSDFALYAVKRAGRGAVAVYDSALHAEAQSRDLFAAQLQHCIADGGLTFYMQPTVDLVTGHVRGFEALARWQHPTRGLLHPATFLPLARELNLLAGVDLAAIDAAADLHARLRATGHDGIRVSINGSHVLLSDRAHAERLPARLSARGLKPQDIHIELAERDVFGSVDPGAHRFMGISHLVGLGFNVLIDGFGAGYAGLLHVDRLAVAGFKVEKALIRHLAAAPACEKITAMLLQFGRDKDLYCTASGIETAEQAAIVRSLGGSVGQGNHFARAMPAEDVIGWLRARSSCQELRHTG